VDLSPLSFTKGFVDAYFYQWICHPIPLPMDLLTLLFKVDLSPPSFTWICIVETSFYQGIICHPFLLPMDSSTLPLPIEFIDPLFYQWIPQLLPLPMNSLTLSFTNGFVDHSIYQLIH
jgi:hypothetical protein